MKEAIGEFYIENKELKILEKLKCNYENDEVIYEVIKIVKGIPLFFEEHYKRMSNSFSLKKIKLELNENELLELIYQLIKSNSRFSGNVKITYSVKSKVLSLFFVRHTYPTSEMYESGVEAISYKAERTNPNAKIMDVELREKISDELKRKNAYEAILVDKKAIVTEGSKSNVFFIRDDIICTPKSKNVLPGVTRTEIIREATKAGIIIEEKNIEFTKLKEYDAAFISGTSPNILPLKSIDEIIFNVNNDILRAVMDEFDTRVENYIASTQ